MDHTLQDTLLFFDRHRDAFPLYQSFEEKLLSMFPETEIRVQKTQISFSNRRLFACVSFQRVKKKADLPAPYIVITLGLPCPLDSDRVSAQTEPWPGRWTTHFVIGTTDELDDEFFSWVRTACHFAQSKQPRQR